MSRYDNRGKENAPENGKRDNDHEDKVDLKPQYDEDDNIEIYETDPEAEDWLEDAEEPVIEEDNEVYDDYSDEEYDLEELYPDEAISDALRSPKKKLSFIEVITSKYVFLTLQTISSLALGLVLLRLDMLPVKPLFILLGVLLFLIVLFFFIINDRRKNKVVNRIFKTISLVLSAVFIFISVYGFIGADAIDSVTGANVQTHSFSAVVLKESPLKSIQDLSGKKIGTVSVEGNIFLREALTDLQKKSGGNFTKVEYEDYIALANALYDKEVDSIVVDEAYRLQCEYEHPDFETETRVLGIENIEEEIVIDSPVVKVDKDSFSVYISGIDTDGPVSSIARSDVNMIVTVNPNTKTILMTSIPRDYYVTLATYGAKDKLTHSGTYGISESISTIENLFELDINYYARVNFTSLIEIVDALGGVDVYSDMSLNIGGYSISEGMNHMDGGMALRFSRERYSYASGDEHRVQNQQQVLTGIINKAMSPAILTNFNSFLASIRGSIETNMLSKDISALVKMQLEDMTSWTIERIQVTGTGSSSTECFTMPGWDLYVMIPDEASVETARQKIDEVLEGR